MMKIYRGKGGGWAIVCPPIFVFGKTFALVWARWHRAKEVMKKEGGLDESWNDGDVAVGDGGQGTV